MRVRKILALSLIGLLFVNATACSLESAREKAESAANTVGEVASSAKDNVVAWYSNLDLSKFKDGWDYSVEFMGAQYSAVMSSKYVANVEEALTILKTDMNSAAGSARGTAQEAGFLAEKWASDTFNLNAIANGSDARAETVGSTDLGSVDVKTNYGENASLKYYQNANGSAQAQAKTLLEAYNEYYASASKNTSKEPMTLAEYMNKNGYNAETQDALLSSIYEGQTRIIPTDQVAEATEYLQGRIDKLSALEGDVASARTKSYQETLSNLRDRLTAPDGTQSKPLTYEELQAIAEVSKNGEFKPEDFGIKLSTVISPKYVMKQAIGTGLEVGVINTVFTIGPDIYSILREASENKEIDEEQLKEVGVDGAISMSEGFVEGSVSRIVTTLCQEGILGAELKAANPSVVATLTVLVIEAAIHGYELSQGKITAEEYGNMMVDKTMICMLAIPTSSLFLAALPATKIAMLGGCMAGGMIACVGYMVTKEAVMDVVDGGGFEAIVPVQATSALSVAKDKLASLNISGTVSSFGDSMVSTMNDGYIKVKSLAKK
ncbi:hypothetical protein [Butyrivibrio sp. AC2005]|uniref:hypothetical protein n=1 Tax=Butyrivibrio sp. AC2005 TaxID=1280672 RepID=UPI0003FB0E51|nr:hypothetical protein [Butyrivibrio sp. AC2005]